jgi:DNA-binding NarL/FixJ family response regulator
MPALTDAPPPRLLLVEPQSLMRAAVTGVARELRGIEVLGASSLASGERALREQRFDALLVAIDEQDAALALLARLRGGAFAGAERMPVAVLAAACDAPTAVRLKALDVRRVLVKPCKVRHVLETVERLTARPPAPGGAERAVAAVPG